MTIKDFSDKYGQRLETMLHERGLQSITIGEGLEVIENIVFECLKSAESNVITRQ